MPQAENTVEQILKVLNSLAPFALAEGWDNVGLLIGSPSQKVTGILIGLDPTSQLLDEAAACGANLVITHHPIIFPSLKSIRTDQPTGAFIAKAITKQIGIIACHTNLDVVPKGVSHILAQRLGLTELATLSAAPHSSSELGFGQVGSLPAPLASHEFLEHLCRALDLPAVSVAGRLPDRVQRVAVCGGSGSDFAALAQSAGAELYICGEVKHHIARWAEEANFCLIDAGHFPTESLICEALATELGAALASQQLAIPVHAAEKQKPPFSFFMAGNVQQPSI